MCGICGVLRTDGGARDPELIRRMTTTLRHRGPDEIGFYEDPHVSLGHARLSIIDLAGGHQPMQDASGSLWITFNGEIFNYLELRDELIQKGHRFRTRSDTEVILALYRQEGEACVRRLNGQWAFAIWDVENRKLFASRDRVGVRPFFYTQVGHRFLFASEIKALLECDEVERELDLVALDQIFTFWVTLPPRTAFCNIWQLPPGHSLVVQDGRARLSQYWSHTYDPDPATAANTERTAEELLSLLVDATRLRLRSDVPVGAYLSGGLDSSLTTSLTRQLAADRLRSFGISFEDAEFDESPYQSEAASFLNVDHTDVHCRYTDIAEVFPDVIRHTEQPILRTAPAPLYLLSSQVKQNGFKVVLTGEGADEIFGGYDIFKEAKIRRFWSKSPESLRRPMLLRRLYPYMQNMQKQPAAYLQHFFRVQPEDLASPFCSHLPRWELTSKVKMFFTDETAAELHCKDAYAELEGALPESFGRWDGFCRAQYLEAQYLLPGYILSSQGDRMAMAHSVEARYPFLDHRVIEFAARLHPSLKMKVLNEKYLLKKIAKNRLPNSIVRRPKQPYRAPDARSFLHHDTPPYVGELMSADAIKSYGIFRPEAVTALVSKCRSGRAIGVKDNMAFVGILSTQLLVREFMHPRSKESTWETCNPNYAATS